MGRTLIVTNDFPPRQGGIESFVYELARRFDPGEIVVYTSATPGAAEFDRRLDFPVLRDRSRVLLPTARMTGRAVDAAHAFGCDSVWFGAAAPLGLMGPRLRRAGVRRLVATTHGHEVWWSRVPGTSAALRRIGDAVDVLTYLGDYTRSRIARSLRPEAAGRMRRLVPGVDAETFAPGGDGERVRAEYGLGDRPVVVCVSRLVPRKGQDTLIRALPRLRREVPGATLLIVGRGPDESRLRSLARRCGVADAVVFAGGQPHHAVPAFFAAGDVFAMPCRTRRGGLEPEALGIVYLEAAATGLPVVVGDSGGAPDTVRDGETGYVVRGGVPDDTARRLAELLGDRGLARAMGEKGRAWVRQHWSWDRSHRALAALLRGDG
ncbi:glycosyltransferase family 4 protein [Allonocardiopsis opalescens]|uniref:Phosphatidylinositol alpha-1,6-mannosyltransferase n=1 Tax=Allonocardiopsis opalescens TaxID=1144618 RepID=A0A2T0QF92_9ACTN|nr:glycosyltransferase family 4 protein [Allonocardiopsis opalescens]PRY02588.1 phosphatidylinositol alpha-1,6-mannosyltransferase [Allonocardiopsis opalescens]